MLTRSQYVSVSFSLVAASLIVALAIIIVNGMVISNFERYLWKHSLRWPAHNSNDINQSLDLIPANLGPAPTGLIFLCAALAIFTAISSLGRMAASSSVYYNEEKLKQRWNLFMRVTSTASTLLIFIGLVIVFWKEYTGSAFHYTDTASSDQRFTRESWVCQMRKQYTSPEYDYFGWTCGDARAARWLLLPLLIVSSILAAMSFVDVPEQAAAASKIINGGES